MERAWALLALTPREIELEFEALLSRRQARLKEADLTAWLAGRYVLTAMHAPRKFPRSPDGIREAPPKMTAEQMKEAVKSIAARRGEKNGDS